MQTWFFFRLLILTMFFSTAAFSQSGWRALFNGRDLDGWEQINGSADYKVEDGAIVGTTVLSSPNSFIATKEIFSDFILEYRFKVDKNLNSGVQIRSESRKDYKNGRVHGYQIEIDPSERNWTGGIYDEARTGWLYTMAENPKGRAAFKPADWNDMRVEASGNSIRTWINGVPAADIIDDMTAQGFIALQVHGIQNDASKLGLKVRFKDIRILTKDIQKHLAQQSNSIPQYCYLKNILSKRETGEGWSLLWDGKTANGWRGAKIKEFPQAGWEMQNGILKVLNSGGAESRNGGDIITERKYKNFVLTAEFKITAGANSGIKYFVDPELNKGEGSAIGCEFQILDDETHPDAKLGVNGNRTCGSLYDLIPAENKRFNGVGEWNRVKIVVNGNHVEHWLNNFKVLEYERNNQMWRALVAYSKYKNWPKFGDLSEGHILLQDHGNEVEFRSIKIKQLK